MIYMLTTAMALDKLTDVASILDLYVPANSLKLPVKFNQGIFVVVDAGCHLLLIVNT